MSIKQIVPGLYAIPLGVVNTFLFDADGLTLVDTGYSGSAEKIFQAVRELGKQPTDIRNIIITHSHPDHIGSLAAVKQATGAAVFIHPLDADIARSGTGFRPLKPAPGLITGIMFRLFIRPVTGIQGTTIEHLVNDGDTLPIAGGLKAIHAPGHCAGQLVFLWQRHGGVLLAADACANMMGLGWSLGYEDLAEGRRNLQQLARLDFQVACFGHGNAIIKDAAARFREKWG